ncbi:MAG: hypothetical protein AMJ90_05325 [candidate division Zixibacteria bacterium SM23_73_2]|nr:MAG: hypothetical protein AMJ90_05325 [candidate division Zixibacteria bacterium SM23_73_2]
MADKKKLILGIILFGSIWGGLEALGIGVMSSFDFTMKSPFLAATGILVLAAARMIFPRRGSTLLMGLVAAGFKFLTLPQILFCQVAVVAIQGAVLELAFSYAEKRNFSSWFSLGALGFFAMYINYAVFSLIETYLVLNPFWVEKGFSGVINYTFLEGSLAAVLCFFFVNFGFSLGKSLAPAFSQWQTVKAKLYNVFALVAAFGCWVLGFMLYR